ncbi:hypothetical protein C5F52_18125 [Limnohabitans sp. TS-CS-82]|nr:hypothetical protein C5F52_18125 [Limnohabitans sp. TS-CS-82]
MAVANKLHSAIDVLLIAASERDLDINTDDLKGLCTKLKTARVGFPFVFEEMASQHINRLGSVLLGPIFTSQTHPWPVDEDSNPMAPLCQINTTDIPRQLVGVRGVVQVWMAQSGGVHGDVLIRVIAPDEFNIDLLTPVIESEADIEVLLPEAVEWLREFHANAKPTKAQFITEAAIKLGQPNADALAEVDWDEWCRLADIYGDTYGDDVVMCMQITGFGDGRLYCDMSKDQQQAMEHLERLKKKLEKKSLNDDKTLIDLLGEAITVYKEFLGVCGELAYPALFGTFQQIQYEAGGCDEPFICFESIGLREWGDGGNAQVFYSQDRGFTFDWSCT